MKTEPAQSPKMRPDTVLIWSGFRTGSTLLFNVMREIDIHPSIEKSATYITDVDLFSPLKKNELRIVKAHHEIRAESLRNGTFPGNTWVVVAVRSGFEQARSFERLRNTGGWHRTLTDSLKRNLEIQANLLDVPENVPFHVFQTDKCLAIEIHRLRRFLHQPGGTTTSLRIAHQLRKRRVRNWISRQSFMSKNFEEFDKETLWHFDHVGTRKQNRELDLNFSPEIRALIAQLDESNLQLVARGRRHQ